MEQAPSRSHAGSPQSELGLGCKLCSSSMKLRGLRALSQARRISISPSFSVVELAVVAAANAPLTGRRGTKAVSGRRSRAEAARRTVEQVSMQQRGQSQRQIQRQWQRQRQRQRQRQQQRQRQRECELNRKDTDQKNTW